MPALARFTRAGPRVPECAAVIRLSGGQAAGQADLTESIRERSAQGATLPVRG